MAWFMVDIQANLRRSSKAVSSDPSPYVSSQQTAARRIVPVSMRKYSVFLLRPYFLPLFTVVARRCILRTSQREVRRMHEAPAFATGAKGCGMDTWRLVGDPAQGSFQVGEVAGAKRLDARLVVTIELRDGVRAASILGFLWAAEPKPKMEGVHRVEGRVGCGVLVIHLRRFHAARSKH